MPWAKDNPKNIAYRKAYQKKYAQTEKEKSRKREYMRTAYEPSEEMKQKSKERCKMFSRKLRLEERSRYNKEQQSERKSNYRIKFIERTLLLRAKSNAKAKGVAFNLTLEDIVIPSECPILHIPIIVHAGTRSPNTPSVDRIIPRLGYIKGNVHVVSWRANRIKHNGTLDELIAIGEWARTQRLKEVLDAG
jgi:hypothetical protein